MEMHRFRLFLSILIFTTLLPYAALAETYYVDFDTGSDANSGMYTSSPWRSLPGTTGRSNWGNTSTQPYSHAIDSSHKIPKGSTIYIKAGTTHGSADPDGDNIYIDGTFYESPTEESERIIVTVSDTWGSGNALIDGSGLTYGGNFKEYMFGLRLSYFTLRGHDSTRKLVFQNAESSNKRGIVIKGTMSSNHSTNVDLYYIDVNSCAFGVVWSYTDNFLADHCNTGNNDTSGFSIGAWGDENCDGGILQDCVSDGDGTSGSDAGFHLVGSTNITFRRCTAKNANARGFDAGMVHNDDPSAAVSGTYIDCSAYDNATGGFACNGAVGREDYCVFTYINCVAWNNCSGEWMRGDYHAYDGVTMKLYHCISDQRGVSKNPRCFTAVAEKNYGNVKVYAKNCVGYLPTTGTGDRFIWVLWEKGSTYDIAINIDYNAYDPSGISKFAYVNNEGNDGRTPSFSEWQAYSLMGSPPDTNSFTSTTINDYWEDPLNHDYHITSRASPLVNAGTYLSTPPYVLTDRDGRTRSNPVEIAPYEYGLLPPTGLRIVSR